jgi:hypothetical protein
MDIAPEKNSFLKTDTKSGKRELLTSRPFLVGLYLFKWHDPRAEKYQIGAGLLLVPEMSGATQSPQARVKYVWIGQKIGNSGGDIYDRGPMPISLNAARDP